MVHSIFAALYVIVDDISRAIDRIKRAGSKECDVHSSILWGLYASLFSTYKELFNEHVDEMLCQTPRTEFDTPKKYYKHKASYDHLQERLSTIHFVCACIIQILVTVDEKDFIIDGGRRVIYPLLQYRVRATFDLFHDTPRIQHLKKIKPPGRPPVGKVWHPVEGWIDDDA